MTEKKAKKKVTKKVTTRRKKRVKAEEIDPNAPIYASDKEVKDICDIANAAEISRLNMAAQEQFVKNLALVRENLIKDVKLKEHEIEKANLKQKRYAEAYETKKKKHDLLLVETAKKYSLEGTVNKINFNIESGEISLLD